MISEKFLHLYGQQQPHGEAWVCGNIAGLTALRDLLNKVINNNDMANIASGSVAVSSSDDEEYMILALRLHDSNVEKLMLPYTDETFHATVETTPFQLIGANLYKKLMTDNK